MRIRRLHNPIGWTSLPNAALEDRDLSWRARGLLAYLLSRPDGWVTDAERLAALAGQPGPQRSRRAEGRDAVLTALRELEAALYLHRVKRQLPAGAPGGRGGTWSTEYYIFDHPTEDPLAALVGQVSLDAPPVDEPVDNAGEKSAPGPEKPNSVNPASLTSTTNHKNSSTQGNHRGAPPALVDNAPLAALAEADAAPAATASTDALRQASALEPGVQMFALRAHLAAGPGPALSLLELAHVVLEVSQAAPPRRRGTLTNDEVLAWISLLGSTTEPASSGGLEGSGLAAAPPPGGLPAAEGGASAARLSNAKGAKNDQSRSQPVQPA